MWFKITEKKDFEISINPNRDKISWSMSKLSELHIIFPICNRFLVTVQSIFCVIYIRKCIFFLCIEYTEFYRINFWIFNYRIKNRDFKQLLENHTIFEYASISSTKIFLSYIMAHQDNLEMLSKLRTFNSY